MVSCEKSSSRTPTGKVWGKKAKLWEAWILAPMVGRQRQGWVEGRGGVRERGVTVGVFLREWNWLRGQILNEAIC